MKSSSRNGAAVRLLAVHTGEGARTAQNMVAFFERDDAQGSAHAIADHGVILLGVPYDRAAWTLRSGNPISDNIELCGFAEMTRAQWLSEDSVTWRHSTLKRDVTVDRPRQMLRRLSLWLAERSRARGIPLRKLTPADVRAGRAGVIGHHDWTVGMNDGTHWDPGPHFPWDVVIADALNPEETTMAAVDWDVPYTFGRTGYRTQYGNWIGETNAAANTAAQHGAAANAKLDALGVAVAQVRTKVQSFDPDNDGLVSTEPSQAAADDWAKVVEAAERGAEKGARDAIATTVAPELRAILAVELGDDNDDQADRIVQLLGQRLAGSTSEDVTT